MHTSVRWESSRALGFIIIIIFFPSGFGTVAGFTRQRQGCLESLTESKRKKLGSILIYSLMIYDEIVSSFLLRFVYGNEN